MKIIQLLTTVSYGDAVSNDTIALYHTLKNHGYSTGIYAENIDSRLPKNLVKKVDELPKLTQEDIIIYHMSTGTDLNFKLPEYHAKKIMIYHNITPYHFFDGYNLGAYELCKKGYEGLKFLSDKVDYCLAVSEYNKRDLIEAGYKCRIDVLPILIPFSDYEKKASDKIVNRYGGGDYTNILFTGRIAPNKKQENVILAFYHYQKYYNENARLFLVGNYSGMEKYYNQLQEYTKKLGVRNVYFTGHIKFDEILAYYKIADVFLSMSEHEGFCVPLVEAMFFDVPVIAYNTSAIASTLGGAALLLQDNNPLETAGAIDYLMKHDEVRGQIVKNQKERLQDFAHDKIEKQFLDYLKGFMDKEYGKDCDC